MTNATRTAIGRGPLAWSDIKINGTAAARSGELFHLPISLSPGQNSSQPVWKDIVVNSLIGGGNLPTKHFWYAQTTTVPVYDTDGNLTNDGRWTYLWNAENRLIQMETTAEATNDAGHPYTKVKAAYDAQGRRISRTIWQGGNAASPTFKFSHRYLYDTWNAVTEFSAPSDDPSTTLTRQTTLTWGLDLSNTPQGAGGVGGLLSISSIQDPQSPISYPSYDGNGNIIAWSQSNSSLPIARREYDAFGNTLVSEGIWPSSYGFSTKPQDLETGLYYYGYRYYDPVTGRWPSRDPIEEEGGMNLYGFVENDGVNRWDYLGLIVNLLEYDFKVAGFHTWRSFMVTASHWRDVMDDWFYERGRATRSFRGIGDPRNSDIASNAGFEKLLACWIAKKAGATVPRGPWEVTSAGFKWRYTLTRSDSAGGAAAYTSATEFLGTYYAGIVDKGVDPADPSKHVYEVSVTNSSGWESATRIPGRFRSLFGGAPSVFPNHRRRDTRYRPFSSIGGDMPNNYSFEVSETPCKTCVLP